MKHSIVRAEDTQQVEVKKGAHNRTMATTERLMLCELFFERGSVFPKHQHENDQVVYVVFGIIKATIEGQEYIVHQGDSFGVDGGADHEVEALEDTVVIVTFTPPREDYRV